MSNKLFENKSVQKITFLFERASRLIKYSLHSAILFLISILCLNICVFLFEDKYLSAKITISLAFCSSFIYYCIFFNVRKRALFLLLFLVNSLIFRGGEYYALTIAISNDVNHNLAFVCIQIFSHFMKYFYYLFLIKKFDLKIQNSQATL
jgi:hypothetical protein